MNTQALRAPLAVAGGVLALLFIAPAAHATDSSVPPVKVDGNPKCIDYGLTEITKFDSPVTDGTKDGVTLTQHDTYYFKWTSTVAVDWVIVKGGPNSNIYKYPAGTFGDDWLHAPMNGDKPYGLSHVEFCGDQVKHPNPSILLDKTGAATAAAGSTFTYSFKATNTGDVTLGDVVLTDDRCESTLTRVEPNLADATFDPGDEWFYTCTVIAPAGPAQVDNLAEVCGVYAPKGPDPKKVCDDDPHTFTVPPPDTPVTPPVTPPATPTATPPSSTPNQVPGADQGDVLPEAVASGRAALRGPSGCVKQAFKARVTGRSIARVTFSVDGKKVKTLTAKQSTYSLTIRPARYGFGRHKIVAKVEFTAASGTAARKLPLTFRRCAQGAVAPRFTG